jgi:hypothetical protein
MSEYERKMNGQESSTMYLEGMTLDDGGAYSLPSLKLERRPWKADVRSCSLV